ncbi:hypothetical protein [Bacillus horti]|uniref:Uncharacterized protein n=1 Tax=Caldalkalibacillus horti TaxID=77523 RepID=A0ABT9W1C2_9BACI|nr:hypothetical protein [Bacillus horti]MDQ0167062.1 hypothetical protein [Bacillus horti]
MNKIMGLVMALLFGGVLSLASSFVIASINGYEFNAATSLPYGILLGLIIFLFANMIQAEPKSS